MIAFIWSLLKLPQLFLKLKIFLNFEVFQIQKIQGTSDAIFNRFRAVDQRLFKANTCQFSSFKKNYKKMQASWVVFFGQSSTSTPMYANFWEMRVCCLLFVIIRLSHLQNWGRSEVCVSASPSKSNFEEKISKKWQNRGWCYFFNHDLQKRFLKSVL